MTRFNVVHVINSLEIGGAERVLCALVGQTDPCVTKTTIITLVDGGPLKTMLTEEGIDVHSLGMSRRIPSPGAVVQLAKQLALRKPALVVTWLNHSNLIGALAARLVGGIPAITELLSVIAMLDQGAVILPGLDRACAVDEWQAIEQDEAHPQYLMAGLLAAFDLTPAEVRDWSPWESAPHARRADALSGLPLFATPSRMPDEAVAPVKADD